ncbi:MAG: hypothetical protein ACK4NS_01785 [Saprospiraceae bacterium]
MTANRQFAHIEQIEDCLRALIQEAREAPFWSNADFLNSRCAPKAWTPAEIAAHTNATLETYIPRIELAVHKAKARGWRAGGEMRYSARGRRLLRRVAPDASKRYKSPKAFNFFEKKISPAQGKALLINAERLLRALQMAREVDCSRASVRKAHSWRGRYLLGELLEWLTLHARKHFDQITQQYQSRNP